MFNIRTLSERALAYSVLFNSVWKDTNFLQVVITGSYCWSSHDGREFALKNTHKSYDLILGVHFYPSDCFE